MIQYYSPNEPTMNITTEGCFCPDGMKLFNKESGICVEKCGKCGVYLQVLSLSWIYRISHGVLIFQQDVLIPRAFLVRWAKSSIHVQLKS